MNDLDLSFTNVENEPGSNSNDIEEENLEVGGRRVASSVKILFHEYKSFTNLFDTFNLDMK